MTRRDATAPRLRATERNRYCAVAPAEFWMSMYAAHDLWAARARLKATKLKPMDRAA